MPLSRFGRRHNHTFGKKKEKWDGDFRKPPKPKYNIITPIFVFV